MGSRAFIEKRHYNVSHGDALIDFFEGDEARGLLLYILRFPKRHDQEIKIFLNGYSLFDNRLKK